MLGRDETGSEGKQWEVKGQRDRDERRGKWRKKEDRGGIVYASGRNVYGVHACMRLDVERYGPF